MILAEMKTTAENHIGKKVTAAVISVPSFYSHLQRQQIKSAAEIAGLKILRIISEPTAAILAYGLDRKPSK